MGIRIEKKKAGEVLRFSLPDKSKYFLTLLLIPLSFTSLTAQDQAGDGPARIEVGSRVRVTAPAIYEGRLVGHVLAFIPDTLLIEQDKLFTRWRVPEADIELIEVSLERKSQAGKLALYAGVTGFVVGGTVGAIACHDFGDCSPVTAAVAVGAILGGALALLGAGIGSLIRYDVWETAGLDQLETAVSAPGMAPRVTFRLRI